MARPKLVQRVVVLVLPQMRLALEIVQPRLRRANVERARDHLEALGELLLLDRQHGDVIERVDVARVLLQDRHIALHGKLVLALAVQRERLLEGLLRACWGQGANSWALHAPAARIWAIRRAPLTRRRGMAFALQSQGNS